MISKIQTHKGRARNGPLALPTFPGCWDPKDSPASCFQFVASCLLFANLRGSRSAQKVIVIREPRATYGEDVSTERGPPVIQAFGAGGKQLSGDVGLGTQSVLLGGPGESPVSPQNLGRDTASWFLP